MKRLLGPPALTWRLFTRLTAVRERALEQHLLGEFRRAGVLAASAFSNGLDAESGMTAHINNTRRILVASYKESMPVYGKPIIDAVGKARKPVAFESLVVSWIEQVSASRVTQITGTTREQLRNIIARGREDGLGTREIAKMIRDGFGDTIGRARSEMIARTETHSAANAAQLFAAESTGVEMKREWIAASDERTRDDHAAADGQVVAMDEPFDVGGDELMYPGDPNGEPEQIINCRCTTGFLVQQ